MKLTLPSLADGLQGYEYPHLSTLASWGLGPIGHAHTHTHSSQVEFG